ncbi:MAG: class I SAM-dependent methyltransferase [Sphingobacteriales bacterium]
MRKNELKNLYDKQAGKYEILRKKKKSFDHKWRQQLLSFAKGKILEVSVGAGANFKFYPHTTEITAVDLSGIMIEKAKESAIDSGINANFITAAVEDLNFEPESFDTIVSTLSLCAYDDPVHVLNLFNRWCKKNGIILLLEHGASKYQFVHWLQDRLDNFQFRKIGCHANRDILDIVKRSNLQIEKYDRKLLGAIYLVWSKPGRK